MLNLNPDNERLPVAWAAAALSVAAFLMKDNADLCNEISDLSDKTFKSLDEINLTDRIEENRMANTLMGSIMVYMGEDAHKVIAIVNVLQQATEEAIIRNFGGDVAGEAQAFLASLEQGGEG